MKKMTHTRPAAIALAVLMAAALGACSKSEQEQAQRRVDQAATQAAEAGRELKADAAEAGRELKADAAAATAEARAEAAKAGEAIKEGARDAAGLASDVAITASVNARLAKDPDLSALRINVDTKDGAVTLTGPAPSQAAKDRAATLAREVEGVKSVTNNLSVS